MEHYRSEAQPVLNKSAKLALYLRDKFARARPTHTLHFASHVCLVGVARARRKLCQPANGCLSRQPEESLKTKHAIKGLESVTKRI